MSTYSDARYALWLHLSDTHSLRLMESELDEVIRLAVAVEEAREMEAAGSASHPICKQCRHRWPQDGQPPYHPGSWCYMFRSGKHVDEQGYCGQWRGVPSPEAPRSVTEDAQ